MARRLAMKTTFSNSDAVRFGWNTIRAHLAPLIILGAAGGMLTLISQSLARNAGGAVLGLAVQLLQVVVALALTRVAMKLYDGEPVDLANPGPLLAGFWPWLLISFLYGLVVTVGLALLIVPGIVLGLTFCFAPFFTAEGQRDVVEAFRQSSRLVRGSKMQLFGLSLMLLGLNLLGLLALGIGVMVTMPMSVLAMVYAFRQLQGHTEASTPHAPSLTARPA
jgi:uncharacterized membrane protein